MKTNNRLMDNSIITESSRIVLLVMNTINVEDDLAYAQRIATGQLTEADKARQAGELLAAEKAKANETDEAKIAAKAAEDKAAADKLAEQAKAEAAEKLKLENEAKGIFTDKDGNQTDKDGKITKTKAELDKEAQDQSGINTDDLPLVDALILKSGVEILDEKGVKKTYEDSEEGIFAFATDLAEVKAEAQVTEFFENNPEIKALYEHLEKGGKVEDFFKTKEKLGEVDITDDKGKEEAILRNLKLKGFDDKRAKGWLKMVVDSNQLETEAKIAETELKEYDVKTAKQEEDRIKNEQLQYQQQLKEHWDNINNIVSKGKLVNYEIPEVERKSFFEFIGKKVDAKGNTAMSLMKAKLPLEQHLEMDWLLFKNFDFSQLIKSQIQKEKVATLRDRVKKNSGATINNDQKIEGHKGPIDINNISVADAHNLHNSMLEKKKT